MEKQGLGRSRGGLTTKVHLRVDGLGNLSRPSRSLHTPELFQVLDLILSFKNYSEPS